MFKITLYSSLAFALVFSLFSLLFYFGNWNRLAIVFVLGLFIGVIAAPEFKPKAFKQAWVFQVLASISFGVVLGIVLELELSSVVVLTFVSAFLGLSASYWIKHIQIP